ncbi:ABC transporter substrate-binding protein [Nesterenkonia sp. MY13]|uniref:ABC transporter substrate-binding protein n=1 Tax=Nesterenkonia sedimenti TaxID=1463632 RepID=A0A7X8TLG6_9MICC|nr:ABC transporter substrate-binding protein [Nesterenkonia sedimenti]NLS10785.1 ABC transporter substrate-binding protein [Nesterenkonia sedimenti]
MANLKKMLAGGFTGALLLGTAAVPAVHADEDAEDNGAEVEEEVDSAEEVDSEDPDTLVIATNQSVEEWNPFNQIYVIEHAFRQLVYEPLVRVDAEDYSPTGGLAEDWDVSDDGLTWTYHLREGMTWHDGEPITAEDVEYTYHIIFNDPNLEVQYAAMIDLIEEIEVIDDLTVEFTLNRFDYGFEVTDEEILPKHIWEEHEGEWSDWANDEFPIIGSGPYQMVDFEVDTFIRYERFDDYFRGPAGFDEIVYQYYTEPDTSVAALESGEVDIVGGLNEAQIERLEGIDGIETNVAPDRRWMGLYFNTGSQTADGEEFGDAHDALQDSQVRQAIHHAIDRQTLIDNVLGGHADPATSMVPNVFSQIWWEPSEDERVDFDLEEANRILDDAGYPMGDNGVREDPDGEPLEFAIAIAPDATETEHVTEYLVEWLDEIGIDLEVIYSEDASAIFTDGDVEMFISGWGMQPNPIYNFQRNTCGVLPSEPGGTGTDVFYCNEEFDEAVAATQSEQDDDERLAAFHEAQRILYDDAPFVFLWYPYVREAYSDTKIDNIVTQPADEGAILGQTGPWAFHGAEPTGEEVGGVPTGVLWGAGGAAVLVGGLLVFFLIRRKQTAEDRE